MGYEKREVRNWLVTILGIIYVNPANSLALHRKNLLLASAQLELLSKIENGFVVPKRKNYEAIMQRLGKTMSICNIHATAEEMEL